MLRAMALFGTAHGNLVQIAETQLKKKKVCESKASSMFLSVRVYHLGEIGKTRGRKDTTHGKNIG